MKLKRDEFKTMLKECILELVQEGKIFQGSSMTPAMAPGLAEQKIHFPQQGEGVSAGGPALPNSPNARLNEMIRATTNLVSKGDPKKSAMYESIIADTAKTTLQKQLTHEMTGGANLLEGAALPEEKAFDSAQLGAFAAKDRWALLAFGGKGKIGSGS